MNLNDVLSALASLSVCTQSPNTYDLRAIRGTTGWVLTDISPRHKDSTGEHVSGDKKARSQRRIEPAALELTTANVYEPVASGVSSTNAIRWHKPSLTLCALAHGKCASASGAEADALR